LEPELELFWDNVGVPVLQGYGLTETSPVISCNYPTDYRFGSLGKVLPGVAVKISPQKEILAKGATVFSGYFKNPEKTKEVFEDKWFKTGDMGELRDGFIYFKGREKDIIVTSEGLNVYPEDVEAALHSVAGVKEGCVIGVEKEGREVIHAVLLVEDSVEEIKSVIDQANTKLADYQKIQSFSIWPDEDFPRTSTMKIKKNEVRKLLREGKGEISSKEGGKEAAPLYRFISKLGGMKVADIRPESTLENDCGLTSLDRVELAAMIEEEFHFDVDDARMGPEASLKQIEEMIETKRAAAPKKIPKWPTRPWARVVREPYQDFILLPAVRHYCRIRVEGLENVSHLTEPVLFIANHQSYFDAPVILDSLPRDLRKRMAIATWREFFDRENPSFKLRLWLGFAFYASALGLNIFLFSQQEGVRKSMEHTGWLLDKGMGVIFFPEGMRTHTGKMGPFREGIGMMVASMDVPVVPVGIQGLYEIYPYNKPLPVKKDEVICRFGKPIRFNGESQEKIIQRLETEVKKLIS